MPNGEKQYNYQWCLEKHIYIDKRFTEDHEDMEKKFSDVWEKIGSVEAKLWAIILLLIANLGVILGVTGKL